MKRDFVEIVRPAKSWFWVYVLLAPLVCVGALISPVFCGPGSGQAYRFMFIFLWCLLTVWIAIVETRSVTVTIDDAGLTIEKVNRGMKRFTVDISKITEISYPDLPVDMPTRAELVCTHDAGTTVIETRRLSTLVEILRQRNARLR